MVNISNIYRRDKIIITKEGSDWRINRGGISILSPSSKHLGVCMGIFERRFESEFKINKDEIVVDVGAAIGDTTLPFLNKAKEVIAVEPEPNNIRCLEKNVAGRKCKIIKKAAWSKDCELEFHINKRVTGHSLMDYFAPNEENIGKISVKAERLDTMLKNCKADVLKIDVQGAEAEVLKGAIKTLKKVKKVIVETHVIEGVSTHTEVEKILKKEGMNVRTRAEKYAPTGEEFRIVYATW